MLVVAVLAAGGCGRRSPEARAAERAQDACIGVLAPVADQELPSAAVLDDARADAEAATEVDDRWAALVQRLEDLEAQRDTPLVDPAVDALREECGRVNDFVRRGGRDPSTA